MHPCALPHCLQVGVNDDGYGAAERVYGSDGSDHEEGAHRPASVAADLAARYEQDAADAAAEEDALARRHAASGAAYFHSHGRQHGGHELLTDLPLAGASVLQQLMFVSALLRLMRARAHMLLAQTSTRFGTC